MHTFRKRLVTVQKEKMKRKLQREVEKKMSRVESYFVSVDPEGHGIPIPKDGSMPPELEDILAFTLSKMKVDGKHLTIAEKKFCDDR